MRRKTLRFVYEFFQRLKVDSAICQKWAHRSRRAVKATDVVRFRCSTQQYFFVGVLRVASCDCLFFAAMSHVGLSYREYFWILQKLKMKTSEKFLTVKLMKTNRMELLERSKELSEIKLTQFAYSSHSHFLNDQILQGCRLQKRIFWIRSSDIFFFLSLTGNKSNTFIRYGANRTSIVSRWMSDVYEHSRLARIVPARSLFFQAINETKPNLEKGRVRHIYLSSVVHKAQKFQSLPNGIVQRNP